MRLIIQESYSQISHWAAAYIVKKINDFAPTAERPFVLGLPTGSTPLGTYRELVKFYNEGKMKITLQGGSKDDSLAMAHTDQIKKKFRGLKKEQLNAKLYELYLAGEQNLVFEVKSQIPVKDTLFNDRPNFVVDSLAFIPFSGDSIIMESTIKKVSGVNVPLFEASMPYKSLLKGLDNQLRVNLDAEQEDKGRYKGLQVGSITAPNNNAGNSE